MSTTQNNNEHLTGESNSRENFENMWKYPSEIFKPGISYPAYEGFPASVFNRDFDEPTEQMIDFYKQQLKKENDVENKRIYMVFRISL